jgi:hypothetical protein
MVQVWIFLGAQFLRNQMRSFRLPTRIDGCLGMRGNLTMLFNKTRTSTAAAAAATTLQTAIK